MARILYIFTNIEMWCNWFTRHSDKVEFVGSSPIISTKVKIAGSTPAPWTTKNCRCIQQHNFKHIPVKNRTLKTHLAYGLA